jgi:A/G-specific adenine glycosylase
VHADSKLKIQNSKLAKLVPALLNWFAANARDLPWRRTRDPYAIWVSEIMLQQTQVKTVIPYWKRWMRELPNVEAVAKASPDKIHKLWEGLGYYARARNLQKAARQIVDNCRRAEFHDAQTKIRDSQSSPLRFPENFGDVLALPGVGRYTAGAICSIALNQPTPILDGNVIRVLTRIFGIGENPRERKASARLWELTEGLVTHAKTLSSQRRINRKNFAAFAPLREARLCSLFNQSLMELGALICTPRNPQCQSCPVKKLCVAFREGRIEELPNLGNRVKTTNRYFVAFVVERNGRFLVRQRPAGVVNSHLWEFPNVEVEAGILPAVEPGFPPSRRAIAPLRRDGSQPDGKIVSNSKPAKTLRKISGGRMPPLPAGQRPAATPPARAAKNLGFNLLDARPLCTVKHSITRHRITLEAWRVQFGGTSYTSSHLKTAKSGTRIARSSEVGVWLTPVQMQRLAFSSAHKKILSRLNSPRVSGGTPETTRGTRVLP